jgi:hypothetical protein
MSSTDAPPNWFCPRCGWENDGYMPQCAQCTAPAISPLTVINLSSAVATTRQDETAIIPSQRKKKRLGWLGVALLVIGVFMPIVSMPIVGSFNYLHNGRGDGVVVLVLAAISGLLIFGKFFRGLIVTALVSLAIMCFSLAHFLTGMNVAREQMAQVDNLFKGIGQAILSTIQLQWGWLPLLAGAFSILAAGLLRDELIDATGHPLPVDQMKAWALLATTGAVLAGILFAAAWLSPEFLRQIRVPSLKADAAPTSSDTSSLANLFGTASAPSPTKTTAKGWQYSENASAMDGEKSAYLLLSADTKVEGMITDVTPTMIVRCQKGKAELLINTETMVDTDFWSSTGKVRVRFDDGQPAAQKWKASTDRQALFAPNTAQFIKQLMSVKTFLFEFTPFNKSAQVVKFDVSGLDTQIDKIATACPKAKLK